MRTAATSGSARRSGGSAATARSTSAVSADDLGQPLPVPSRRVDDPLGPHLQCLQLAGQIGQCGGAGPGDEPGGQRAAELRPHVGDQVGDRSAAPRGTGRGVDRRSCGIGAARSACSAATTTSRTALFRCGLHLRCERGEGRGRPGRATRPVQQGVDGGLGGVGDQRPDGAVRGGGEGQQLLAGQRLPQVRQR